MDDQHPTGRASVVSARALVAILAVVAGATACSDATDGGGGAGAGGGGNNFGDAQLGEDGGASDVLVTDGEAPSDGAAGDTGGPCEDGALGCKSESFTAKCVDGEWVVQDKCPDGKTCVDGLCGETSDCAPGDVFGCVGINQLRVCADGGGAWVDQTCPDQQLCVEGACAEVSCVPGVKECAGEASTRTCKLNGSGFGAPETCPPGTYCLGGQCLSLCEQNLKVASNVGCEYWTADLDNYDDPFAFGNGMWTPHSVVISNPGIYDAEITFTAPAAWQAEMPAGPNIVEAGKSKEFKMPVMNVDGNGVFDMGIFVKSSQPVVAYQFNPFNADQAFSNDGSLLIPVNALGKEYYAMSIGSSPPPPAQHGYVSVIATSAGETELTVTLGPEARVVGYPVAGAAPKQAGQVIKAKLQQGQVMNLEAETEFEDIFSFSPKAMMGTHIVANKPIAVFGGHEQAVIAYDLNEDSCCAEHLEEQLIPVEAWGKDALCAKTKPRGNEPDEWVIMAGEPGVTLSTDPPVAGIDGETLANPGDYVRAWSTTSFELKATGKVQVGQFIVSRDQTVDFTGDPTFIIHPPEGQLRTEYFVLTPNGYSENYASVIRREGKAIQFDGSPLNVPFQPMGSSGWEVGYVSLSVGDHRFESEDDTSFGLVVYGYSNATAYGYPGGMNLLQ